MGCKKKLSPLWLSGVDIFQGPYNPTAFQQPAIGALAKCTCAAVTTPQATYATPISQAVPDDPLFNPSCQCLSPLNAPQKSASSTSTGIKPAISAVGGISKPSFQRALYLDPWQLSQLVRL